jgi:hypothetical protein
VSFRSPCRRILYTVHSWPMLVPNLRPCLVPVVVGHWSCFVEFGHLYSWASSCDMIFSCKAVILYSFASVHLETRGQTTPSFDRRVDKTVTCSRAQTYIFLVCQIKTLQSCHTSHAHFINHVMHYSFLHAPHMKHVSYFEQAKKETLARNSCPG